MKLKFIAMTAVTSLCALTACEDGWYWHDAQGNRIQPVPVSYGLSDFNYWQLQQRAASQPNNWSTYQAQGWNPPPVVCSQQGSFFICQ